MWFSSMIQSRTANKTSAQNKNYDKKYLKIKPNNCRQHFGEYLLNSTLHGLRYVGETEITIYERIFFVLAFILVFVLSIYFISNIYQKWSASPVIIALNATATLISDFPFPAVTICNMNQAKRSIVEQFGENTIQQELLASLCNSDSRNSSMSNNSSSSWTIFKEFLLHVSQPCTAMLYNCRFATKVHACMELFNSILTDAGLCCTFNALHPMFLLKHYNGTDEFPSVNNTGYFKPTDWSPENGWLNEIDRLQIIPRPAAGCIRCLRLYLCKLNHIKLGSGSRMGLTVVLNAELSDYYCSSTSAKGFKILLHSPTEIPKISDYGIGITTGKETRVVITAKIADASPVVRSTRKAQRQCIFADENKLLYFRTYTRKNCEMECESNIMQIRCGCVLYFMPRLNDSINICGRRDYSCYKKTEAAIMMDGLCKCLPACFDISYKPTVYTATLGLASYSIRERLLSNFDKNTLNTSISIVNIYYEDNYVRSSTKEELIGFTDFLSNTGGILGLFMGFSVVSIIEIVYFLTLKPFCAKIREKKKIIRKHPKDLSN